MTTAEPPADPWRGRRLIKLIVLLGSLTALGPLTIDSYLPAFPQMAADLHATESQVQATLTGTLLGMGLGQLVIGPWSDTVGRRLPLLLGMIGHTIVSLLIMLTGSIELMTVLRLLQGLCQAAVAVVVMAIIRDLFSGFRAVNMLSRMALVTGLGPIIAPNVGGLLLTFGTWHLIFAFLAVMGAVLTFVVLRGIPETLPPERRHEGGLRAAGRAYRTVVGDPRFAIMLVVAAMGSVTLFSYIAASSFILQSGFGLDPQQFALVFAINGLLMIVLSQVNPTLARVLGLHRTLTLSVAATLVAAVVMLVIARAQVFGMLGFVIPICLVVGLLGFNMANTTAIALEHHGRNAGTANALLGAGRFAIAGLAAPLVGTFADGTAMPLAVILVGANALSLALLVLFRRRIA